MTIIDFVKDMLPDDKRVKIVFEYEWLNENGTSESIDEEYSFEGCPSEFIEKYTVDYDCIDSLELLDLSEVNINSSGLNSHVAEIYMKYCSY